MRTNKKKSSSKKKGKAAATPAKPQDSAADRVARIEARCSVEKAAELEHLFQQDYPPSMDYDEYFASLSNKQQKKTESAYIRVATLFSQGIQLTETASKVPGISRWHFVIEKQMDALDVVIMNPDSFLKTINTNRRELLAKICLTVGQCLGKTLDAVGHVAWGKAAVAADPTYFNAHNMLGLGYLKLRDYEKALEASQRAHTLLSGTAVSMSLPDRLEMLQKVVHDDDTQVERELIVDGSGAPVSHWQEMQMERPAKTCAFCNWPGDKKCSKCLTVYYCSVACQKFDHKQHKLECVKPSDTPQQQDYPKPNFAQEELCSDAEWEFLEKVKRMSKETSMVVISSNNCHAGAVKRALMDGEDVNTLGAVREHPVHLCALRREPDNAVEIMRILIQHGACPNVIRGDGKHLLSICRDRAKWIDDSEPSMGNTLFRLEHFGDLEEQERRESEELVELVSKAIEQHKLCRLCKARKQYKSSRDAHLYGENLADQYLARQKRIGKDS